MGIYVDVMEKLETRLTTAQGVGKKLEDVKEVYFGERILVEKSIDTPRIMLTFVDGNELFSGQNRKRAELNITVTIIDRLKDENVKNLYFDASTQTGIMYVVERTLDVIHETLTQVLDARLDQESYKSNQVVFGGFEKLGDGFVQATITLTINAKEFILNQRSV